MKKTLALLVATSALSATLGLPVWSSVPGSDFFGATPMAQDAQQALPMLLASNEGNEGNENEGGRGESDGGRGGDDNGRGDDDNGRENGGEGDDDGDNCKGTTGCVNGNNPAPAGSVPPPQNGLFNNSTAPQVKVN